MNTGRELIGLFYLFHGDDWNKYMAEWSWLTPSLLAGTDKCPCKCVPALAYLAIKWERGPSREVSWSVDFQVLHDLVAGQDHFIKLQAVFDDYRQKHAENDPYTCQTLNHVWEELGAMDWTDVCTAVQAKRQSESQQSNESDGEEESSQKEVSA